LKVLQQTSFFKGFGEIETGALFSPCHRWRYQLWRIWGGSKNIICFIGLNPSTADEFQNDPTVRRAMGFARSFGGSGLLMCNAFAFRATLPRDMKVAEDPIGVDNDKWLVEAAGRSSIVIAAWGVHGVFMGRGEQVKRLVPKLHHLGLTKAGDPKHPLYLRGDTQPQAF
jgi:hypothetical protein